MKRTSVCVFCASACGKADAYRTDAAELGTLLARRGIRLVYGAGHQGLMGALANTCLAEGGSVTGVIPAFMVERGWGNDALTQRIETKGMHERKERMLAESEGVIALPGGIGTMEELLEVITWKQLGLYTHPVVLLNTHGFYEPFRRLFCSLIAQDFLQPVYAQLITFAATPKEAVEQFEQMPEWEAPASNQNSV